VAIYCSASLRTGTLAQHEIIRQAKIDKDTVGGLVFNTLEHVPVVGESIEAEGWRFTVTEMDGRRIQRVRVDRIEVSAELDEVSAAQAE
jgi:CBS domain containing-hemolysin-like protein